MSPMLPIYSKLRLIAATSSSRSITLEKLEEREERPHKAVQNQAQGPPCNCHTTAKAASMQAEGALLPAGGSRPKSSHKAT